MTLFLLLACAVAAPELDTETATCMPLQDQGADLYCGETGQSVLFCVQGDGCWYTDGNTVNVPVWDCRSKEAINDAQEEVVAECGWLDW